MPFEFDLYKSLASKFYDILLRHAVFLQAVSVDEALLEVEPVGQGQDAAMQLAQQIRDEIRATTGCEASIGISHNILLARLATRKAKPANAYQLMPDEVPAFLAPLPVDSLPGIGWSIQDKLENGLKITHVGQLTQVPLAQLQEAVGETLGAKFEAFARGVDPRELQVANTRQSVSAEVNYGIRMTTNEQVAKFVRRLAVETASRLKEEGLKTRFLNLKVMRRHPQAPVDPPKFLGHGWCETKNASTKVSGPGGRATDDGAVLGEAAWKMMSSLMIEPKELRGIGIQLSKLEKNGVPVDVAIEPGQTRLAFRSSKPTLSDTDKLITKKSAKPALAQPTPSIIISEPLAAVPVAAPAYNGSTLLSALTTDSKPFTMNTDRVQPTPEVKRKRKVPKPTRLASIFDKAVEAAELKQLGIDLDWWNSVDHASRQAALTNARKRLRITANLPADKPFAGSEVKPRVIDMTNTSSPIRLTDDQLRQLGLDPDIFHELPPSLQQEQFNERSKHFMPGTTITTKRDPNSTSRLPTVPVRAPSLPVFSKSRADVDVHDILQDWVDGDARVGPAKSDAKKFRRHIQALVESSEFALAAELLSWFGYLIDEVCSNGTCSKAATQAEWREAWQAAFDAANAEMVKTTGSSLRL